MKIDKNGKVAYWCKTKELSEQFLQECDEQGIHLDKGSRTVIETYWDMWKDETCYSFENSSLFFSNRSCYSNENFYIVEYVGKNTKARTNQELEVEIARLTAENKSYADNILTAIRILQNSDGFKAQTAINQAIGVLLGNKDNKWKREID